MKTITLLQLNNKQLKKIRKAIRGNMGKIADTLQVNKSDVSKALNGVTEGDLAIRKEAIKMARLNGHDIDELLNS